MIKRSILFSLFVFFSLILTGSKGICSKQASATVLYCYDGDTCRVKTSEGLWFNVRLFGIDAHEMPRKKGKKMQGQPFSEAAKNALNLKVKDKSVKLNQADLDAYNRPIVEFWMKDRNINLEMVVEGWAEVYRGKTKRIKTAPYFEAEKIAKKKKLGIWKLENYQSPSEFRKKER